MGALGCIEHRGFVKRSGPAEFVAGSDPCGFSCPEMVKAGSASDKNTIRRHGGSPWQEEPSATVPALFGPLGGTLFMQVIATLFASGFRCNFRRRRRRQLFGPDPEPRFGREQFRRLTDYTE